VVLFAALVVFFSHRAQAADPFAENVRTTEPLTPEQQQRTFRLPPGFEIQLVTAEPTIAKPMNMAFDARGRLWVTSSREYPYAAPLDKPGRDAIVVLSDFAPDGRARQATRFAEGLNIPIGLYPYRNGVIAWSIPNIWRFEDLDGDLKSDRREVLFGPLGWERDTHGMNASFRRGFDGWLYISHGFNNNSTVRGRDGHQFSLNSGNTYRIRLDGSRAEQFTWGQVNPFGMCFDPLGRLYSADCHSSPIYLLQRGGYYPSFGKPHDGLGFAPTLMQHSHNSTAIAGLVYYADDLWPAEYQANLLVGNVMTSRINRDRLTENAGLCSAEELPDFLTTEDPWFRPVDLQLGPDGALYVADFYNRIIGHYEVPLEHPGRDRERGRIWRIVYRGQTRPAQLPQDGPESLLAELGHASLQRRTLAMNELVDRIGPAAVEPVRQLLARPNASATQRAHGLWVLDRLGALDDKTLALGLQAFDRLVRVHALRIVAERPAWSLAFQELAISALADPEPQVQAAAADVLALHPDEEHVPPLLVLHHRLPASDSHLRYAVRKALRDQLRAPGLLRRLAQADLSEPDARALASTAVAVPTDEAALFLLAHVSRVQEPQDALSNYLRHAARHLPDAQSGALARVARSRVPDNLDLQVALLKSIQQGIEQRGTSPGPELREWGAELVDRLLAMTPAAVDARWQFVPADGTSRIGNPWFVQTRNSSDGDSTSRFLSSLPPGGEELTGTLRSPSFQVPSRLRFFAAGHDGAPAQPAQGKNKVRLRHADSGETLHESPAPRNDLAQPIAWNLEDHVGKRAYLEVVDGDDGSAFAWLAAGRFDPPVLSVPPASPNLEGQHQRAAADIVRALRLERSVPALRQLLGQPAIEPESAAAIGRALAAWGTTPDQTALVAVLDDPGVTAALRTRTTAVLAGPQPADAAQTLSELFKSTPYRVQLKLAQSLAASPEGVARLFALVNAGAAPPALLLERSVKDRAIAAAGASARARVEELTQGVSPPSDAVNKRIAELRKTFRPASDVNPRGEALFTQHCRVCHQLGGVGNLVGPQLDGTANRGLERLLEDLLDPNRNVDPAFRTTLLTLQNGDVVTGLLRREDATSLILAEANGHELPIDKRQIKERRQTETSLMPDNFGEILRPEELSDLLSFLLAKPAVPPPPRSATP
jgi:putative heme-binding domain-containing protein